MLVWDDEKSAIWARPFCIAKKNSSNARFTLGSLAAPVATFQATVDKTGWTGGGGGGNAGRHDGQTWEAVIAVPDITTVKKFATAVTVRIRNLAGRSKTGWTQENVPKRDSA